MKNKDSDELIFKIITIGNSGVGKTSIIKRYVHDSFDENALSTIGIGLAFKEVAIKNGKTIKLKFVDTAGQEAYKALTKTYYKNTDAVLFVFSLDDKDTYKDIEEWIKTFKEVNKDEIPKYLIGNKCDLQKKCVSEEEIEKLKNEHNLIAYFFTSAKLNTNINDIFIDVSERLYQKYKKYGKKNQNSIHLEKHKSKNKEKKSCGICDFNPDV
jgi:small GTP-binding protein